MTKLSIDHITARMLKRLEEINSKIAECEKRLDKLKPTDFYQNESLEIMTQILKNQYKVNALLDYIIKYTRSKIKIKKIHLKTP